MASKSERIEKIKALLDEEKTQEEIIEIIVGEFEISEATVKKDIKSLIEAEEQEEQDGPEETAMSEKETDFVHVEIENVRFDEKTRERLSAPFVQIYRKWEWKGFLRFPNGYTINKIIHMPDGAEQPKDHHMTPESAK